MGKRFFKGALLGSLFGVGLMWLSATKRGREVRARLTEHADTLMKEALKRIPENDWVDKKKVERVLNDLTEEYARTKDLAGAAKNFVFREVKRQLKARRSR